MIRSLVIASAAALLTSAASAECPAKSPSVNGRVTFDASDKRVNAAWLSQTLAGRRLKFDEGTEQYNGDGTYAYTTGSNRWDAPEYKFYDNGLRCIGYPDPRFDIYVVNGGNLVLIDGNGNRYVGSVLK